jgi:CRP-like cAMP-binding protein
LSDVTKLIDDGYAPQPLEGVDEVEVVSKAFARRYVLVHPKDRRLFTLGVKEHFVWGSLDGEKNLGEIKQDYYNQFKVLPTQQIMELVQRWHTEGFLGDQPESWKPQKERGRGWWGAPLPGLLVRPFLGPIFGLLIQRSLFALLILISVIVMGGLAFLEGPFFLQSFLEGSSEGSPTWLLGLFAGFYLSGLWRGLIRLGGLWREKGYKGDRLMVGFKWIFPGIWVGERGLELKSRELQLNTRLIEWIGPFFLSAVLATLSIYLPLPDGWEFHLLPVALGCSMDFIIQSCPFIRGAWLRCLDAMGDGVPFIELRSVYRSSPLVFAEEFGKVGEKIIQLSMSFILVWVVVGSSFLLFTLAKMATILGDWGQEGFGLGETSSQFWQVSLYAPIMLSFFWMLWKLMEPFVLRLLQYPVWKEERLLVPVLTFITLALLPLHLVLPPLQMRCGMGLLAITLLVLAWSRADGEVPLAGQIRWPMLLIMLTALGFLLGGEFRMPFEVMLSLIQLGWAGYAFIRLSPNALLWWARTLVTAIVVAGLVITTFIDALGPLAFVYGIATGLWASVGLWSLGGQVGVQSLPAAVGSLLLVQFATLESIGPISPEAFAVTGWMLMALPGPGWARSVKRSLFRSGFQMVLEAENPRRSFMNTLSANFSMAMGGVSVDDVRRAHRNQPRLLKCLGRWGGGWLSHKGWESFLRVAISTVPWADRREYDDDAGGGNLSKFEGEKGLNREQRIKIIKTQLCFKGFRTADIEYLADNLEVVEHPAGHQIISQGEMAHPYMEIVLKGQVSLERERSGGQGSTMLATLGANEAIRLEDLFEDRPYDFSGRTLEEVVSVRLYRSHLVQWSEKNDGAMSKVLESLNLASMIMNLSLFRDFSSSQVRLVMERLQRKEVPPGKDVIKQGEEGDEFYLLDQGGVDILIGEGTKVAELGPGSYFGEIALLQKCKRTATVRTNVPSVLFSLTQKDFDRFFSAGRGAQVLKNVSSLRGAEA